MKKNSLLIIALVVIVILGVFCFYPKNSKKADTNNDNKLTDSEKFAKEYNLKDEDGKALDNVFVYRTPEQIINILEKGTGIVYLGFPECPWCTAYVPYLNEIAKEKEVEKIYYLNILEERKNNTDAYKKITEILSDYLQNDEEGNKRLYVPAVIAIKDGKIVGFDDETAWDTKGYEKPADYWANEDLEVLKNKLKCMMQDCKKDICTSTCNK